MGVKLILKLFFILQILNLALSNDSPSVKIGQGELKGVHLKSRDGKSYSAFMGIPYADKPEKFELAKPPSKWDGVRDATQFGGICSQFSLAKQDFDGEDDCLFVNVFTPNTKGKFPVMVFIHGGGFWFGNSNENGADYFMDEEVILVTLNYRLGALGFLSMGDDILPGNLGIKDQRLALQWVKENIVAFGGDPTKTTLFGESAGAASVIYHVISPGSEGLFQYVIAQSGSALNPWALSENPKQIALNLAENLNCPKDSVALKKCLKSKSSIEIVKHSPKMNPPENSPIFVPTIEPQSSHAFITEHPEISYKSGRFNKVPLVMTLCEKEGLLINSAAFMKNEKLLKDLNENWFRRAPHYFLYDDSKVGQEAKDLISKRIKKFYFGDEPISQNNFENLTNLYSDSYFIHGVRNTALLHGSHAPVYPVVLAYEGYPWSHVLGFGFEKPLGMTHADDLPFIFSNERYPKFVRDSESETVSKYFVKAFVSMATIGNPNLSQHFDGWLPMTESQISSRNLEWMYVNLTPKMMQEPIAHRMRFWDSVAKKLQAQRAKEEL